MPNQIEDAVRVSKHLPRLEVKVGINPMNDIEWLLETHNHLLDYLVGYLGGGG